MRKVILPLAAMLMLSACFPAERDRSWDVELLKYQQLENAYERCTDKSVYRNSEVSPLLRVLCTQAVYGD